MLSRLFIFAVNSVLGLLRHIVVGHVDDVSEVNTASCLNKNRRLGIEWGLVSLLVEWEQRTGKIETTFVLKKDCAQCNCPSLQNFCI
jgi:hypothetical protein